MNATNLVRILISFCALLSAEAVAQAATLQAKVTDVQSGNTIVVSNINRPLKVRLKGIAPPEAGQPFSDAAREHLKLLVFDKTVFVEYTNLSDGYLEARVTLNGIDLASQMIRDGVAWYDRSVNYGLTDADQNLYAQCEDAAKTEKRGLWSSPNPVTPWEFRRAQQAQLTAIENSNTTTFSASRTNAPKKRRSFSNSDLFGGMFGGSSSGSAPAVHPVSENGTPDRWIRIDSATEHFSISIPSNAVEGSLAGESEHKDLTSFHFFTGGSEEAFFFFISAKGPQLALTDAAVSDEMIQQLIAGMNQGASEHGEVDRLLSIKNGRAVTLPGITGKDYALRSDAFGGTARVLTRKSGDAVEIFVMMTMTRAGSEALGTRFINSFKLK